MFSLTGKNSTTAQLHAIKILESGVESVLPEKIIKQNVSLKGNILHILNDKYVLENNSRLFIIGGGKAATGMAQALEEAIFPAQITGGLVNSPIIGKTKKIILNQATHPIPGSGGLSGVKKMFKLTEQLNEQDIVICLISGGGSALLPYPAEGISLSEIGKATRIMINGGVEVYEMQYVRKHTSRIKGGRLAKHLYPAKIISLILSDVVNPQDITAAGPTEPDNSTYQDAYNILEKYNLLNKIPQSIIQHLHQGVEGKIPETPKPSDPIFKSVKNYFLANYQVALNSMLEKSKNLNYHPILRGKPVLGDISYTTSKIANEIQELAGKHSKKLVYLYNSEITITVKGKGKGGRCQEFTARLAQKLKDLDNFTVASIGSDGADHIENVAGAIINSKTHKEWVRKGTNVSKLIENNNSYELHKSTGTLINSKRSGTNVGDLHLCLINTE